MKVPKLQKATLTERITLPLKPGIKQELKELKDYFGVDTSEWIRQLIESNLPDLKKQVNN